MDATCFTGNIHPVSRVISFPLLVGRGAIYKISPLVTLSFMTYSIECRGVATLYWWVSIRSQPWWYIVNELWWYLVSELTRRWIAFVQFYLKLFWGVSSIQTLYHLVKVFTFILRFDLMSQEVDCSFFMRFQYNIVEFPPLCSPELLTHAWKS